MFYTGSFSIPHVIVSACQLKLKTKFIREVVKLIALISFGYSTLHVSFSEIASSGYFKNTNMNHMGFHRTQTVKQIQITQLFY